MTLPRSDVPPALSDSDAIELARKIDRDMAVPFHADAEWRRDHYAASVTNLLGVTFYNTRGEAVVVLWSDVERLFPAALSYLSGSIQVTAALLPPVEQP